MKALHPIAQKASRLFTGAGPQLQLPAGAEDQLVQDLEGLRKTRQLAWAVRSLVALAAHVELDLNAARCADALLRVAASASGEVHQRHDAHTTRRQDRAKAKEQGFYRFSDRRQRTRAPSFGARAPAGAIRASMLSIPAVIR